MEPTTRTLVPMNEGTNPKSIGGSVTADNKTEIAVINPLMILETKLHTIEKKSIIDEKKLNNYINHL